jgi:pimeloyl-ACP methyl ester carboxylesterase
MMAEAQETFVTVCDCRVLLRRGGAGEPLLYLHGARGLPGWLPFLGRLAERHDVIAPDHPGYGRSQNPAWLEEIADLALFYLELLKQQDLTNVHVVGHSMGGWIALEMAIRSTARIKTLTAISSAGIRIKGLGPPDVFAMDRDEQIRTYFHDPATIERELNATLTPEQQGQIADNLVTAARLGWHPRFFNPKLRKWLRRIDVPTHIIWGDSDKILVPAYASELQKEIAGSQVTILADAGHMLHMEKPDAVAEAVAGFAGR